MRVAWLPGQGEVSQGRCEALQGLQEASERALRSVGRLGDCVGALERLGSPAFFVVDRGARRARSGEWRGLRLLLRPRKLDRSALFLQFVPAGQFLGPPASRLFPKKPSGHPVAPNVVTSRP